MSIDPRTIKALLQLQLTPSLNNQFQSSPLNANNGDSRLFDELLSQVMGASATSAGEPIYKPYTSDGIIPMSLIDASAPASSPDHTDSSYDGIIQEAAAKYGVDPSLIRAVIHTESGFEPNAVSSAGAKGLMQLMDGTARGLGVQDSFDPRQNVEGGTKYLGYLLRKYNGHEGVALAAYNAGPGRVDRLGIATTEDLLAKLDSLPQETQNYVSKVLQAKG
ncbi:lytic transglycosylase domain-containing protein [Paenibacillus sp. GCM10023252]|uniref:lytic transglycosylase domain-containing protein n=1 Tax=Paenibacillus sp. GCM10023252 TaxID=3252649 RepID=UPI00360AF8FE